MAFTKIVEGDLTNKGVRGLPDTPNLGTTDMQNKFEEISVDVIVPKHNGLIDELEATTAAASIGALDANGDPSTVQAELVSIKSDAYTKAQADALFLTQTDAASTYLAQTDAASTYLAQTDAASTYLAQTDAATTYLNKTDAASIYLNKTDAASDYLNKTDAASTYLSQSSAASTYLSQSSAASTYLSQSDAASTYVAQVSGKDLSSNDYTDADKSKLAGIEAGANNYVLPAGTQSTLGGVMGDGTTFTIDSNGVGHAVGGGGGTSDYDALTNHPEINGVELIGDKLPSAFGFEGDDIGYDNTISGLSATTVQGAIDEVAGFDAADIGYTNTTSGLSATTVQGAIDEVEGRVDTAETNIGTLTTSVGGLQTAVAGKEAAHTVLTSTLTAGSTTLSFTNAAIGDSSLIRVYSDPFGVAPTAATQSGTTVTLTFDAQQSNVSIAIEVRN